MTATNPDRMTSHQSSELSRMAVIARIAFETLSSLKGAV